MSNTDPFQGFASEFFAAAHKGESFGKAEFLPVPEKVAGEVNKLFLEPHTTEDDLKKIHKVGMKLPMTWEALVADTRKGGYVPVGNKYLQKFDWWLGKQLFRFYQATELRLQKFRHYREVSGYDYEEAEYREFEQKKVWREEA